jgi:hypothetical protein
MRPSLHPVHRTGCADFPLPAVGERPRGSPREIARPPGKADEAQHFMQRCLPETVGPPTTPVRARQTTTDAASCERVPPPPDRSSKRLHLHYSDGLMQVFCLINDHVFTSAYTMVIFNPLIRL